MLVTTSYDPSEDAVVRSKILAAELNCQWIKRNKQSFAKLKEKYKSNRLWIVTNNELKFVQGEHAPLFFHPSTASIRIKRVLKGERDTLMECSGAMPGDSVLDCTAGMASDSIIFSHILGETSKVIALESEKIPFILLREGLRRYDSELIALNEAMRRIEVKNIDHNAYLKQVPDKSIDIVYFDPMFRKPIEDSSALAPLRVLANHEPLQLGSIQEAKRAARKAIVLKEHRNSAEFERLGFEQVYRTQSKIAFGVIKI